MSSSRYVDVVVKIKLWPETRFLQQTDSDRIQSSTQIVSLINVMIQLSKKPEPIYFQKIHQFQWQPTRLNLYSTTEMVKNPVKIPETKTTKISEKHKTETLKISAV